MVSQGCLDCLGFDSCLVIPVGVGGGEGNGWATGVMWGMASESGTQLPHQHQRDTVHSQHQVLDGQVKHLPYSAARNRKAKWILVYHNIIS